MSPGWQSLRRVLPVSIALIFAFLLIVSRFAAPRSVHLRWDYDYTHDPPCASPWAANCTLGFYVFLGGAKERSQALFVNNRFDAKHQVVSQGLEAEFRLREFGYLQFCVVAVKQGAMGIIVESAPLCSRRLVLPHRIARRHNW
jgi:hypothetical protein